MSRDILARRGERVAVLSRGRDHDEAARLRSIARRRYGWSANIHTDDVGRVQVILHMAGANVCNVLGFMSAAAAGLEVAR